jgi:23S rRNA (cytidine1920-2'-O)/16S rRNA (cytidine1409-2'-O)-methyltransferase
VKKRLDVLLVERGLAESRTQAQALVLAGRVPGHDKPGMQVDESTQLEVDAPPPYVSRGGHKLAHASCCSVGRRVSPRWTWVMGSSTNGCVHIHR